MKAILIDPLARSVNMTELATEDEIRKLIGFDTIIFDEIGKAGDRLYFDEDGFLRGTSGRFQLDSLAPVAGKALVVGSAGGALRDVATELESLRGRIQYL